VAGRRIIMAIQWSLIVFTLFVCLGAGIFALQGFLAFRGKGIQIQLPCLIGSLVSVVIGGIASFLHLQHWERFFGGFGHLSSGITQELIAIAVFVAAILVYFIMLRRSNTRAVPQWCGIMAIVMSVVLILVMSHSYNMPARPTWDTPILWLYYLANALLFGCLVVSFFLYRNNDAEAPPLIRISVVAGVVQLIATAIYTAYFALVQQSFTDVGFSIDPTNPTKELVDTSTVFAGVFAGEHALLFWTGVILGALLPLLILLLTKKKSNRVLMVSTVAALACALIGSFCFRVILYVLGFSVFTLF
jgi:anaerobic dimethyl sulfoxide reductase subunit C (anchor subunit)